MRWISMVGSACSCKKMTYPTVLNGLFVSLSVSFVQC